MRSEVANAFYCAGQNAFVVPVSYVSCVPAYKLKRTRVQSPPLENQEYQST